MNITTFVNLVSNSCFPVVVSAYLLLRVEKQINSLTSSVNMLNTVISTKLGYIPKSSNTVYDLNKSQKKF